MSWVPPYPYYPPYMPVPTPPLPDPTYLMWSTWSWMLSYYYMTMYLEMYKAFIDVWKKSFEALAKTYESLPQLVSGSVSK